MSWAFVDGQVQKVYAVTGIVAMLCNVLTPSTEVWRAKSTLFLLPSPVARSVSITGSASIAHMQVSNPSYIVYANAA